MKLELSHGHSAVLLSAYAPTMDATDQDKEAFYNSLSEIIRSVPYKHRIILLGDFNARVGRDHSAWPRVLGHHSIGNEHSNGSLLLQFCAQHELTITNTLFQQANKYKCTWMHPRSKHWHMLDYFITRHRHVRDVHLTRVMRGVTCWSDHCLVWSTVALRTAQQKHGQRTVSRRRLDVRQLGFTDVTDRFQDASHDALGTATTSSQNLPVEQDWISLQDAVYETASQVLGFKTTKHHDWFDDQDIEAQQMLDDLHRAHIAWMKDKNDNSLKSVYTRVKQRKTTKADEGEVVEEQGGRAPGCS